MTQDHHPGTPDAKAGHPGQTSGHSSYYYIDIGIIIAGALLVLNGDLLLGGLLFAAGCVVHFDWLGLGLFK